MTRPIAALLARAAAQFAEDGVIDTDIQTQLAAEGYLLSALDRDVEAILAAE